MARKHRPASNEFAVCIDSRGYEASLEAGKLYRMVADAQAEKHGYLRVIDESGEDYGYSASRFLRLKIPSALAQVLASQDSVRGGSRTTSRQPQAPRLPRS